MDKICRNCASWDNRPDAGMDIFTGYCGIHEKLTNAKFSCDSYERKAKKANDAYLTQKYSEEDDDLEEEY